MQQYKITRIITRSLLAIIWAVSVLILQQAATAQEVPEVTDPPELPDDGAGDITDPVDQPELPDDPKLDPVKITELSEKYGVETDQVQTMRADGMGWGEMEIALGLSSRIEAGFEGLDGEVAPGSLDSILQARADGLGWGEIAAQYDLKVGDVMRSPKSRKPAPEGIEPVAVPAKQVNRQRPDKGPPVKVEKVERPDRPDKPQRPSKVERPERPQKVSKPEKPARPTKPEKPSKPQKPEKPGRGVGR